MVDHGIYAGDTLIVDRSLDAAKSSIVVVAIDGELTVRCSSEIDREDTTIWGVVRGSIRDLL